LLLDNPLPSDPRSERPCRMIEWQGMTRFFFVVSFSARILIVDIRVLISNTGYLDCLLLTELTAGAAVGADVEKDRRVVQSPTQGCDAP